MADQTGVSTEPALGVAPAEADVTVEPGEKVPLWPPMPRPVFFARVAIGAVLAAAALYAPFYFDPAMNRVLSQAIYLAIAAMGLNLLLGFNGQVSIGHGAFYGVGAFTSAILMIEYDWSFEPTIIVSAVLTGVIGLLIGLPALRVRGPVPGAGDPRPGRPVPARRDAPGRRPRRGRVARHGVDDAAAPPRARASRRSSTAWRTTSGSTSSASPSSCCCSSWRGT